MDEEDEERILDSRDVLMEDLQYQWFKLNLMGSVFNPT